MLLTNVLSKGHTVSHLARSVWYLVISYAVPLECMVWLLILSLWALYFCHLPGASQNHPFPVIPLAPHREVSKALHVLRLATHKLPVPLDAFIGLNTGLLCCKILCWVWVCKELKALSQTLHG